MKPRLILVVDPPWEPPRWTAVTEAAASVLPAGALGVQLRAKEWTRDERAKAAADLLAVVEAYGQLLFINGDVELSRSTRAHGVHLPGLRPDVESARAVLGARAWISVAAHDDADVVRAAALGANATLVSPIWQVPGKGAPRGLAALRSARLSAPSTTLVYALGGVDVLRAAACAEAGADGVAVSRALLGATDVGETALALAAPFRHP